MAKKKLAPKEDIPVNTTETIIINTSEPILIPKVESVELGSEEWNETFRLILDKIKALTPDEKEFKIGKYIFKFIYCLLKDNKGNYKYETNVPLTTKTVKLSNVLTLALDVKGFHDDYITRLIIIRDPDNTYITYIINLSPERDFFEVVDFLSQI